MAELELIGLVLTKVSSLPKRDPISSPLEPDGVDPLVHEGATALLEQAAQLRQICTWESEKSEGKRGYSFQAAEQALRSYLAMRKRTGEILHRLDLAATTAPRPPAGA